VPVFQEGKANAPAWSELEIFFFEYVKKGEEKTIMWRGPKERYVSIEGSATVVCGDKTHIIKRGEFFDIPSGSECVISTSDEYAGVCRCCGNWGAELGGTGLFPVFNSDDPVNSGDPADYLRNASFDNHYHDCDEYWIIFQGGGVAYSENKRFEVKAGDCVATGRGYHHDFPVCSETVCAVFLETTLVGQKRIGHLWEHTHGKPALEPGRV